MEALWRPTRSTCLVLFGGAGAPAADEALRRLQQAGARCDRPDGAGTDHHARSWAFTAEHGEWGRATVHFSESLCVPPREFGENQWTLLDEDLEEIQGATSVVRVSVTHPRGFVPRVRKGMLWFARAVMGDSSSVLFDEGSMRYWSAEELDDELCHDADLDLDALHIIHAVGDQRPHWVHSHGLAEIGGADWDVLNPDLELPPEVFRALSFLLLQPVPKDEPTLVDFGEPAARVALVPLAMFEEFGDPEIRALRERDDYHSGDRFVVCDPPKKKLVGGMKPLRASAAFQHADRVVRLPFASEATAFMADRAKATLPLLRRFMDEFEEFEPHVIAKIGLKTRSGELEYPWFTVERLERDRVHGFLMNEPFDIPGLTSGDRGTWGVETLADWLMFTPAGSISPHGTAIARVLRRADEFELD